MFLICSILRIGIEHNGYVVMEIGGQSVQLFLIANWKIEHVSNHHTTTEEIVTNMINITLLETPICYNMNSLLFQGRFEQPLSSRADSITAQIRWTDPFRPCTLLSLDFSSTFLLYSIL
jgi:hypothetical protein